MHKNHRERLKKRFLTEGLDHFEPHNILELLLFFAIPQKDTNELAHELIRRFGSLSEVFDAPFQDLVEVPGIKEHAATLIKLVPRLARSYMMDKNCRTETLSSVDKIGEYFINKYIGANVETVYLLLLDNKYEVIECILIHEGSVNSAAITTRRLAELALHHRASMAAIAHNHPSGLAIPSSEDIYTTRTIARAFDILEIRLLAHILVAGNQYTDILSAKFHEHI